SFISDQPTIWPPSFDAPIVRHLPALASYVWYESILRVPLFLPSPIVMVIEPLIHQPSSASAEVPVALTFISVLSGPHVVPVQVERLPIRFSVAAISGGGFGIPIFAAGAAEPAALPAAEPAPAGAFAAGAAEPAAGA